MEKIEFVISMVAVIATFLVGFVATIKKMIQLVKEKDFLAVKDLLKSQVDEVLILVEQLAKVNENMDSNSKKAMAVNMLSQYCSENGIKYDNNVMDTLIENAIGFSKKVNV